MIPGIFIWLAMQLDLGGSMGYVLESFLFRSRWDIILRETA